MLHAKELVLVCALACVAASGVRVGTGGGSAHRGRFTRSGGARCSWRAARSGGGFALTLACRSSAGLVACEYVANPEACGQYAANQALYWRQIGRALKRQERLCREPGARVRAGVCRGAPGDAHFRLSSCAARRQRLVEARRACTSSWSALCTFVLLMLESDECAHTDASS